MASSRTYTECPKCGHRLAQPQPGDASCPACGIVFFKWVPRKASRLEEEDDLPIEERQGWLAALFEPMARMDTLSYYGRWTVLAGLAIWSWFLIRYDYRDGEMSMSFMHNILLPIHEAGHIFFAILGEFMKILGGSLFQLLLPFAIGVAFIVKRRDNFGAAVCFWWTSVSLVDLSPYIYDALHPQLVLTSGRTGEDGPHDWIYLLNRVHQLQNAQLLGALAHFLGALLMAAGILWAFIILLRQRGRLGDALD